MGSRIGYWVKQASILTGKTRLLESIPLLHKNFYHAEVEMWDFQRLSQNALTGLGFSSH